MKIDVGMVAALREELQILVGGRIDKITQPERDEIHIAIRAGGGNHRILLTANAQAARAGLISASKPAPATAPQFCMVLRKHIGGGRISAVTQPPHERILSFAVEARDEMNDPITKILTIEMMGRHSNIILHHTPQNKSKIIDAIKHVAPSVSSVRPDLPGMPYESPPRPPNWQPRAALENIEAPSAALEEFFTGRDAKLRTAPTNADLRKLVGNLIERTLRRQAQHDKSTREIAARETLKITGELITAYAYAIPHGASSYTAANFHDEMRPLHITLDPALSPHENAAVLFKKYAKQKRTAAALEEQTRAAAEDLAYLTTVQASLDAITTDADIAEIRAELASQGYIKARPSTKKSAKTPPSKPLHYKSSDGFDIYVGKNNTQNDNLTFKVARADDIWLHTKDIPGSHVIIMRAGREITNTALHEAAALAVAHSKAAHGASVPVDYAPRKHIKKPTGAKPGFVIYENYKTIIAASPSTALPLPQ
jgi:predicted ribosome quality control (RQC) complex YloA/Tae2 family protein